MCDDVLLAIGAIWRSRCWCCARCVAWPKLFFLVDGSDDVMYCTGPNAVRVLKSFGVLDEIIACSDESAADMKTFNFIYGTDNNDFIYHVCVPVTLH